MSNMIQKVKDAILPVLDSLCAELVDIEFAKKFGQDNLTVFVHTEGGVTLDYCEKVHLAIDPVLDEINPTGDKPYVLNVSSPGLDRPFKTQRDFERNYGTDVEVKLYAPLKGKKAFEGVLTHHDDNCTIIETAVKTKVKSANRTETANMTEAAETANTADTAGDAETKSSQSTQTVKIENSRIALVRPLVKF